MAACRSLRMSCYRSPVKGMEGKREAGVDMPCPLAHFVAGRGAALPIAVRRSPICHGNTAITHTRRPFRVAGVMDIGRIRAAPLLGDALATEQFRIGWASRACRRSVSDPKVSGPGCKWRFLCFRCSRTVMYAALRFSKSPFPRGSPPFDPDTRLQRGEV